MVIRDEKKIQAECDKNAALQRLKSKVDDALENVDVQLESEKKCRMDLERNKRQADCKTLY